MKIISGCVSEEIAAKLGEVAAQKRASKSEIVSLAVRLYLTEHLDLPVALRPRHAHKDGLTAEAEKVIQANNSLSLRSLQKLLHASGISRCLGWIAKARARIR